MFPHCQVAERAQAAPFAALTQTSSPTSYNSEEDTKASNALLQTETQLCSPSASATASIADAEDCNPAEQRAPVFLTYFFSVIVFAVLFGIFGLLYSASIAMIDLGLGILSMELLLSGLNILLPATASDILSSLFVPAGAEPFDKTYYRNGILGALIHGAAIAFFVVYLVVGSKHYKQLVITSNARLWARRNGQSEDEVVVGEYNAFTYCSSKAEMKGTIQRWLTILSAVAESATILTGTFVVRWWTRGEEDVVTRNVWFALATNLLGVVARKGFCRMVRGTILAPMFMCECLDQQRPAAVVSDSKVSGELMV